MKIASSWAHSYQIKRGREGATMVARDAGPRPRKRGGARDVRADKSPSQISGKKVVLVLRPVPPVPPFFPLFAPSPGLYLRRLIISHPFLSPRPSFIFNPSVASKLSACLI